MSATAGRLPAAERRKALIETAIGVFAEGSYRGVTTAEIAKAAGVSEPILYRHFACKRDLYLAAVESVWCELRSCWDEAIAAEPEPARWLSVISQSYLSLLSRKSLLGDLWVQALSEASQDEELRKYLRRHIREVHAYVVGILRRLQEEDAVLAERDAEAEAWTMLAGGLLATISRRIGVLRDDDLRRIQAARRCWLTGERA